MVFKIGVIYGQDNLWNIVVFDLMFKIAMAKVAPLFWVATFLGSPSLSQGSKNPVEIGLERFRNQKSFRFEWEFRRPGVKGEFKGRFEYPDRIGMKGAWHFGKMEEKGEWFARGDEQFEWDREKKEWMVLPRGEETDPLRQMFRILSESQKSSFLRKGDYKGKSFNLYGFDPNAPFLDPSMEAELKGEIWMDPKTHLPLRVTVSSPSKEISWDFLLSDYNEAFILEIPSIRYQLILQGPMKEVKDILEMRMKGEGFEDVAFSVEREEMRVGFRTSLLPEKKVEYLIAPGHLRTHLAEFPEEPVSQIVGDFVPRRVESGFKTDPTLLPLEYQEKYGREALLVFERGDVTKPLILQKLLLTEEEVEGALVAFDELSRPMLRLVLTEEGRSRLSSGIRDHLDHPLGIVIDGECISSLIQRRSFTGKVLEVPGEFTLEEVEGMVLRLKAGPLPKGLKVVSLRKL